MATRQLEMYYATRSLPAHTNITSITLHDRNPLVQILRHYSHQSMMFWLQGLRGLQRSRDQEPIPPGLHLDLSKVTLTANSLSLSQGSISRPFVQEPKVLLSSLAGPIIVYRIKTLAAFCLVFATTSDRGFVNRASVGPYIQGVAGH